MTRDFMNQTFALRILYLVSFLAVSPALFARDVSTIFDQVERSVVEVHVEQLVAKGTRDREFILISSQGSGVLVSADGKVITVSHLVQSADTITIRNGSGDRIPARVIASEPAADIALLQLERVPADLTPVMLGNSDEVQIGQQAFIVGAPYGLRPTVTVGYISGRHHPKSPFGPFHLSDMFLTDASMHQGISGAPLFDMNGKVIGIATQVVTTEGKYEGLGFAVSSNTARSLLLEQRSLWSGIEGFWLSGGLAQALNLPQSAGLLVERIASHSPGSKLMLQAGTASAVVGEDSFVLGGDVILSMQGISLAEERGYARARARLALLKDGEALNFTVLRAGKRVELSAPVSR
jgi:serine protease Do